MSFISMSSNAFRSTFISVRTLHLFTLCGFAVTQPLLTSLSRQTVYIFDQEFNWLEIGMMVAALSIVLPFGIYLADQTMLNVAGRFGRGGNAVFFLLFGLMLLSVLRPYFSWKWLTGESLAGILAAVIALVGSLIFVRLYEKTEWLKSWLTVASFGLVIFPCLFLLQFREIRRTEASIKNQIPVNNPVPVVLVVFDEFSGTTLMNEQLGIDAQRFPQFARLADCSTWYRNATTVHARTEFAVPSILSGRFPPADGTPLAARYPGNLLRVIHSTDQFDMAVFEPVSRLSPKLTRLESLPNRTSIQKTAELLYTLATVYPRLIFPRDTPIDFPTIPKSWFGIRPLAYQDENEFSEFTEGLFSYSGYEHRDHQLRHFLKCLKPGDRPRFGFLHVVLPHVPWTFLPSGGQYFVESEAAMIPAGATGELAENWLDDHVAVLRNHYRYRLQVGYVDRFIGQLLDRLEETEMLDRCLLIVMADHGVSFRPGHSRRVSDTDNLADILSVPLFVKLPGQTDGRSDDRNVESIDILPTIAEVLGIELPEPIDGISVSEEIRRPRKTLYFENTMTVIEPTVPHQEAAVRRQLALFGQTELHQQPTGVSNHPEWHGRSIETFEVDARTIPATLTDPHAIPPGESSRPKPLLVRAFIKGDLNTNDLPETPVQLVVAVNGIIRETGTTFSSRGRSQGFEFMLPQSALTETPANVELYLIDRTQNRMRLRRLETSNKNTGSASDS